MNPTKAVSVILLMLASGSLCRAQVPQIINYQGRVSVAGTNFDGSGQFKFALVDGSGAPTYWSNGVNAVSLTVTKGLYSVLLGDTNVANMTSVIPVWAFTNPSVWLRVWFNDGTSGFQQMTPDQRLGAAGYALQAASLISTGDVAGLRLNIGLSHTLTGSRATIGGGYNNQATYTYATVGGGSANQAKNNFATVAGGAICVASGDHATVTGGGSNTGSGGYSAIGGGQDNVADGGYATIAGGYINYADATGSTVAGGQQNTASGNYAMVPGGLQCQASGDYSFAAGKYANATHPGSFVWVSGDWGGSSFGTNTFYARAGGGVHFVSSDTINNVGVQLNSGGSSWSSLSDRNAKENFEPLDCRQVLERLATVPVTKWNLKSQPAAIRHIGPMAQDFYAAFKVGEDDLHISTSDADGIAFAAIQGLYQELKEKDGRIAELEKRLAELEARMQRLSDSGGKRIGTSGPQ